MDCPACREPLAVAVDDGAPTAGSPLSPTCTLTLTCAACGFAESGIVVPGVGGEGVDAWLAERDRFHREIREFVGAWEDELSKSGRERAAEELARLIGLVELIGSGDVPDELSDIELWVAKRRALEGLLGA